MDKAPPPEIVFRTVRWAVLLFLAYAFLTGFHIFPQKAPPPAQSAKGRAAATPKEKDCASEANPLEDFSMLASSLLPTYVPVVKVNDTKPGAGMPASCGQQATLRYSYKTENGSVIFSSLDGKETTKTVIGDDTMLRGFSLGLLGMKPGGERTMTFPPALGFEKVAHPELLRDHEKFSQDPSALRRSVITATASLISLSPELPSSSLPLRIIERKATSGAHAVCGDTVRIEMTLWKADGTKLFSTTDANQPLVLTLGASQIPYGLEQAIIGMAENGYRTVILPAGYARPLIPSDDASHYLLHDVTLPDEIMLAEIHLAHIGQEASPVPAPRQNKTKPETP